MKKIGYAVTAALTAAVLLTGCTPIDEEVGETTSSGAALKKDFVCGFLTEDEIRNYDLLSDAVYGFEPIASFTQTLDREELKKLFVLLYNQDSRIFWMSSIYVAPMESSSELNISYRYTKEQTESMRGELELAAGTVLGAVKKDSTDYETVRYFHDYIVENCSFSKDSESAHSAYGALVDGYAQCEGYAFGLSYLCDKAGIENYVVCGANADGSSHAWNKVKIDGEWYNVDCTWDDPILKHDNPDFVRHDYFLVRDTDIYDITHFPDTAYFTPLPCTSTRDNYFEREGLYFDNADDGIKALTERIKTAARAGEREAEIRFNDKAAYDEAYERLFENKAINDIIGSLNGLNGLDIKSAYKYNNDELNIIHLSLIFNGDKETEK